MSTTSTLPEKYLAEYRAVFEITTEEREVLRELLDRLVSETRAAVMESCARIAVFTGNTTDNCMKCCYAVADHLRAAAKELP